MPAHRFPSSDWPILETLITHVTNVPKRVSKMYLDKGKTWWAGIGTFAGSVSKCKSCKMVARIFWTFAVV